MKITIPKEFLIASYFGFEQGFLYFTDSRLPLSRYSIFWKLSYGSFSDGRFLEDWLLEDLSLKRIDKKFDETIYPYPGELDISGKWEQCYLNGGLSQSLNSLNLDTIRSKIILHAAWKRGLGTGEIADFSENDLRGLKLENCNLSKAIFRKANLQGASLLRVDLSDSDFFGADLSGSNLEKSEMRNANLSFANLENSNLREVDLYGANLTNVNINNANLERANLCNVIIENTIIYNSQIRNARLDIKTKNYIDREERKRIGHPLTDLGVLDPCDFDFPSDFECSENDYFQGDSGIEPYDDDIDAYDIDIWNL